MIAGSTVRKNEKGVVAEALVMRSLQAARVMGHALAEDSQQDMRVHLARSFCHRVVSAWWSEITQSAVVPLRPLFKDVILADLADPGTATADSIGGSLAQLAPEEAIYAIGSIYTVMLPDSFRSEYGVYYTPPPLVEHLLDQATRAGTDWASSRVLDPACGGGAFLAPVARRMLLALPDMTPAILVRNIASRLKGYEIDPFAAWLSQVTLDAVMLKTCREARTTLPVCVTVCDSLERSVPKERFDLVIGNPPYGRITLSAKLRERYKRGLYGHANLYGLFTDLALRYAKVGGIIAYVTPTSFLAGGYFRNLRDLIARLAPPVSIDFVATRKGVFDGVLQETLLATYRRGDSVSGVAVQEIIPNGHDTLKVNDCGTIEIPNSSCEPWIIPRGTSEVALVAQLRNMHHKLEDWGYRVSTGPLVWNRQKDQLRRRAGRGRLPLIWAEAITSDGRFVFRAEKKNHEPYFQIMDGDDWLVIKEPCVLLQRTTAKEQARRLIAACLPQDFLDQHKAVVVENHLNMVRSFDKSPLVQPEVVAAFLNSSPADRAFRSMSGSVAVSAFELEALPLPAPNRLVKLTKLVHGGADRAAIDAECERLFQEYARGSK